MIHFVGIKGSGMASLACILHDMHQPVKGSDIEKYIFTQKTLEERGIQITPFDASNIEPNSTVIIGNAFDETNCEVKQAKQMKDVQCFYYHDYLGKLLEDYTSICIAGTHGKTTTTGMVAHLCESIAPTGYLIGDGTGFMRDDAKYFALEACEYKRHFMAYHPDYAIITNIDLDHVDYYKDLEDYKSAFMAFSKQAKHCIVFGDDLNIRSLHFNNDVTTYGLNQDNDVRAIHFIEDEKGMRFDVEYKGTYYGYFEFDYVGKHMLFNSLSVITLAILEGQSAHAVQKAMSTFENVKRRFNVEIIDDNVYIDDYAHHPTAIKVTMEAARIKFPNKKLIAIFKPDRYSRIYSFMDDFARELGKADETYLCPFPENAAHEDGIDIDIYDLAKLISNARVIAENKENAKALAQYQNVVYLFMSSKDIYKFKDIVKKFHK